MKQASNQQRRSRGRSNNSGGARRNPRNQNFESNGPEVKVRGSAQQVLDKYLQLARDAQSGGDRVKAEAYLQFAEHYYRIVNAEQDGAEQAAKRDDKNQDRGEQPPQQQQQGRNEQQGRGRRRNNGGAKNEATAAAEAAAQNAAPTAPAPNAGDAGEAEVVSTAPVEPVASDDKEDSAANA